MKLSELYENPDNPSVSTTAEFEKLKGKLKRVPGGLKAMRIAYVTDGPQPGKMVISGNKRLRALKEQYGQDAELPDEYFQDVTDMSLAERHEFIVTANISDGHWDVEKLLALYDISELDSLMSKTDLFDIVGDDINSIVREQKEASKESKEEEQEDLSNKSTLDGTYKLGECSVYCGNVEDCDRIRKFYAEDKYGLGCDWAELTPKVN